MSIDLDKKDQLGTPWRKSFVPEYELIRLFDSIGVTVEEATELRRTGALPDDIKSAWDQYDALNEERFGK